MPYITFSDIDKMDFKTMLHAYKDSRIAPPLFIKSTADYFFKRFHSEKDKLSEQEFNHIDKERT